MTPARPLRRRFRALALVACGLAASTCKTATDLTGLREAEEKAPQCDAAAGFVGRCSVVDVIGRQGTTTDAARASTFGDLTQINITVPANSAEGTTELDFTRKSGPADDCAIKTAADLYDRKGCLAQVVGGLPVDSETPTFTARAMTSLTADGHTAFIELTDNRGKTPVAVTVALKCLWQRR